MIECGRDGFAPPRSRFGNARLADIADVIARARDEAGVDHAVVELMYLADDVDQALQLGEGLVGRRPAG